MRGKRRPSKAGSPHAQATIQTRPLYYTLAETLASSLDEETKDVLIGYSTAEEAVAGRVNGYLRGAALAEEELIAAKADIEQIDRALALAPRLPEPLTVYRGYAADFARFKREKIIREIGYISASLDQEVATRFARRAEGREKVVCTIDLPLNTKVAALWELAEYPSEEEVLLPRGSAMQVMAVSKKEGLTHVRLRYLG